MSMIYTIQQASDATIDALLTNPALITSFLGVGKPPPPKRPGFFARLFGARDTTCQRRAVEPVHFEIGDDECDLDKAWHGLHYLLSGSDWEGDPPQAFLLNWGTEIGTIDVGYGPARAYTASQTKQVHECLRQLDAKTLRARFDSAKMMELDIYPTIWDRPPEEDDTLGYLMEAYEGLKSFVARTGTRNYGMVSHLG